MRLTLGPIPYLWSREEIISFYEEICSLPVSVVYIGEVVCSKRSYDIEFLKTLGNMLEKAGKEVIISTFGLITTMEEIDFVESLRRLPFPVEVNNTGAFNLHRGREVVSGPYVPIYNSAAAAYMSSMGIRRMVFMPELDKDTISAISGSIPSVEKEIIAFGNLPLAFSWRCYTARALKLHKANCAISCRDYPEGMQLDTMDGMPLFDINGTQLMGLQKVCLIKELDIIRDIGIEYIRLIPQLYNTPDIIDIFDTTIRGVQSPSAAIELLKKYAPDGLSNGWFYGKSGWQYLDKEIPETGALEPSQFNIQNSL